MNKKQRSELIRKAIDKSNYRYDNAFSSEYLKEGFMEGVAYVIEEICSQDQQKKEEEPFLKGYNIQFSYATAIGTKTGYAVKKDGRFISRTYDTYEEAEKQYKRIINQ